VPDWVGGFDNPDWPHHFAEYARAFADRYPWIRLYTPVNEIYVAAAFSGQNGWWNQRATGDRGFVVALETLCRANVMAMHAILTSQGMIGRTPVFIQSESSEYFHPETPDVVARAEFFNEQRFLALDLTYGRDVSTAMYEYLAENDLTHDEYRWFRENARKPYCVLGTDYYATNEHLVRATARWCPSGEIFGYYVLTRQYFQRYRLPVMHTETNADEPDSARWLWKEWAQMVRLKQDGIPIVGFTWYSLTDQVDWDNALREQRGTVNPRGLYDLDRKIRPVGRQYRSSSRSGATCSPPRACCCASTVRRRGPGVDGRGAPLSRAVPRDACTDPAGHAAPIRWSGPCRSGRSRTALPCDTRSPAPRSPGIGWSTRWTRS
jgi:beta-glucosidase/6-phospho-beta-glucosidase/beta-galactosidase